MSSPVVPAAASSRTGSSSAVGAASSSSATRGPGGKPPRDVCEAGILRALTELNGMKGSSLAQIKKHVRAAGVPPGSKAKKRPSDKTVVGALNRLAAAGDVVRLPETKDTFKLSVTYKRLNCLDYFLPWDCESSDDEDPSYREGIKTAVDALRFFGEGTATADEIGEQVQVEECYPGVWDDAAFKVALHELAKEGKIVRSKAAKGGVSYVLASADSSTDGDDSSSVCSTCS